MNDLANMGMQADLRHRQRIAEARRERMAQEAIQAKASARQGGLLASAVLFVRIVRLVNRQRAHQSMANRTAS
jgi:hypothetical protein